VNTSKAPFQSNVRYYWLAWATILCGFGVAQFVLPPRFAREPNYDVGLYYMLGVWLPVMFLNFFEGRRLKAYLRQHHPTKWAELTTFAGFGPGWINGFRFVPWLFSADTLSDPAVAQLKSDYRRFIYWVLIVFFTFPIFIIAFSR